MSGKFTASSASATAVNNLDTGDVVGLVVNYEAELV